MATYRRIAAVSLAVEVLRFLAEQKEPVSGRTVASALNQAHGTIMCHLATLEDEKLVRCVGEHWELDMGLALFWARYRSKLEGTILRAEDELRKLEVE